MQKISNLSLIKQAIKDKPYNESLYGLMYNGNAINILKQMPDESVDCVMTSPPFWGLRNYKSEPLVWEGEESCIHEWGEENASYFRESHNATSGSTLTSPPDGKITSLSQVKGTQGRFCCKCNAWFGSIGQEPTFELFLDHLMLIFSEVYRVLKKTGTCFVEFGDTFASSGGASRHLGYSDPKYDGRAGDFIEPSAYPQSVKAKSLCNIPHRFAIKMTDEIGFIQRNFIVWHKINSMPSSAKSRFTVDHSAIFFFVKSNSPQYYVNPKTLEVSWKKPKEEESKGETAYYSNDSTANTGENNKEPYKQNNPHLMRLKIPKEEAENFGSPRARNYREKKSKKTFDWQGRDYFFETQYEPIKQVSIDRLKRAVSNKNKYLKGDCGQSLHQPRPNTNYKGGGNKGRENNCAISTHAFGNGDYLVAPFDTEKGRIKRCVWSIPTKSFSSKTLGVDDTDHFAVYNPEIITAPILAGCPARICPECRIPMEKIGGKYTDCKCEKKDYDRGVILDPFAGSFTTCLTAKKLGRNYIGIELSKEYCDIGVRHIEKKCGGLF